MHEMLPPGNNDVERCGLLLSDGTFVELQNMAESPINSFEMDPAAVLPLIESGHVVSTWHTHPHTSANLSGEDHSFFLNWPDLTHIIFAPEGMRKYEVKDGVLLECS